MRARASRWLDQVAACTGFVVAVLAIGMVAPWLAVAAGVVVALLVVSAFVDPRGDA